jgi:aryl-alcohol dehydrogenase-like predicted oxidoreductase/histidinol phosphatase-like enzyme
VWRGGQVWRVKPDLPHLPTSSARLRRVWTPPGGSIGLGCMRLSTSPGRDEARGVEVLHAAFDAGVTFLDTADAYCLDQTDSGHNERLIARAIASWRGDRSRIVVATKGGLTRPDGRWVPDGRAKHLAAACEASLRALGVDRIALYQLHAPDPRIPLATSVRALAALQRDGLVDAIGLCNVTVGQIEDARRIAEIAAVQIEMSPWNDDAILGGVAGYCVAHGIRLIAHRPLGGEDRARRIAREPAFADVAARHGATPQETALAWLAELSPAIVPIPGATRVETARSIARAAALRLTDADRQQIDARFTTAASLRGARARPAPTDAAHAVAVPEPRAAASGNGEVVLIMGLPGAGKSTLAQTFAADGYARLNRDEAGGTLRDLVSGVERLVHAGHSRIVLDNTYASRTSRARVVQAAAKASLPVRCVWLSTGVEDAQLNTVWRMWSAYGRLLTPDEMRQATKRDVSAFAPGVQFRYQRDLEPPAADEGFARIDCVRFERQRDRAYVNRAAIVWCDGVLARSRAGHRTPLSPADVEIVEPCARALRRYADDGWRLLGLSWQPAIADGTATVETVEAVLAHVREQAALPIEIAYCPHGGGPPICWCRKPLPGLGVAFIRRYLLDAPACVYIGTGPQDASFAQRLGFQYRDAVAGF